MEIRELRDALDNGYGCWDVYGHGLNPASVPAITDRLVADAAIADAFHRGHREIWIKFQDSRAIADNRHALKQAFAASTY